MAAENTSRFNHVLGVLGWFIAATSLVFTYLTFTQSRAQLSEQETREPKYRATIETYEPANFPENIRSLKEPIRHAFRVGHDSGDPVKGLTVQFTSLEKPILKVDLVEGLSGTQIESTQHEAVVRRSELLPGTVIRGFIVTEGITTIKMSVGAEKGRDVAIRLTPPAASFDWEFVILLSLLVLLIVTLVVLAAKSLPALQESGLVGGNRGTEEHLPVLLLAIFLAVWSPDILGFSLSAGRLLDALLLYFLVTRYRLINEFLRKASS